MPKPTQEEVKRLADHRTKIWNKYYVLWRNDPVYCPALECKVSATKAGWEHIAGLSKFRTINDTHRRLDIFKYAREIVSKSGTVQYIRHQNGYIHYTFEAAVQYKGEFDTSKQLKRVKVVVVKKERGDVIFHSVMD